MKIQAGTMHFRELNARIRQTADREIEIDRCVGQRYIASGLSGREITISGIPAMPWVPIWTVAGSWCGAMPRTPQGTP